MISCGAARGRRALGRRAGQPHLTRWAEALPGLVAPGGTLLVIARATDDEDPSRLPWRAEFGRD